MEKQFSEQLLAIARQIKDLAWSLHKASGKEFKESPTLDMCGQVTWNFTESIMTYGVIKRTGIAWADVAQAVQYLDDVDNGYVDQNYVSES